jgi:hypothetical protein
VCKELYHAIFENLEFVAIFIIFTKKASTVQCVSKTGV